MQLPQRRRKDGVAHHHALRVASQRLPPFKVRVPRHHFLPIQELPPLALGQSLFCFCPLPRATLGAHTTPLLLPTMARGRA